MISICIIQDLTQKVDQVYLCGIASVGADCEQKAPSLQEIYTDVSKYSGWIKKHTGAALKLPSG